MSATQDIEKVKVSELIAQALEDLGIKHVFGIIGAGNVHLFEAISRHGYTERLSVFIMNKRHVWQCKLITVSVANYLPHC
jgi:uncharacterized protein (DUF1697 family)